MTDPYINPAFIAIPKKANTQRTNFSNQEDLQVYQKIKGVIKQNQQMMQGGSIAIQSQNAQDEEAQRQRQTKLNNVQFNLRLNQAQREMSRKSLQGSPKDQSKFSPSGQGSWKIQNQNTIQELDQHQAKIEKQHQLQQENKEKMQIRQQLRQSFKENTVNKPKARTKPTQIEGLVVDPKFDI